ncbi:MAG: tetratricopeptide repeat protein [Sedimentisphaerales bacterium]|nr:tetratricopeptide repeat protein [Sedimentisphaerales bacterium]
MDHNHTNCCCSSHSKEQTGIARERLYSTVFVIVLIFLTKPFIADQLIKRADAYYCFGLYDDAIRQYQKVLFLNRADSDIWVSLGHSFVAKREINKAIAAFRKAVKIAPEDRAANFNLGMAFVISKDYNSAVAYFEKVRKLGAESEEQLLGGGLSHYKASLKMLVTCLEKLQQFEKAAEVRRELKQAYSGNTLAREK